MLDELFARLAAATEPNRTLDHAIARAVGTIRTVQHEREWDATWEEWPNYTAAIDAAMTLVPEGWCLYTLKNQYWGTTPKWFAGLANLSTHDVESAHGRTGALAIILAALKARRASTEQKAA